MQLNTSIPQGLKAKLPYPDSPWKFSDRIYEEMKPQVLNSDNPYKICSVKNTDPEYDFLLTYFNHSPPTKYQIKNVYCVHSPTLTNAFVSYLEIIESKGEKFKQDLPHDKHYNHRMETLDRWKGIVNQFYPIKIERATRTDTLFKARLAAFWHGSSEPKCKSICGSGFTYFGKHHFVHPNAERGSMASTDPGYFGSGMYFTTSAEYASKYSNGHLMLAFVSMNEPYPVISDVAHPNKCSDMKILETLSGYQTYNAHYIPVASIRPNSHECMEYYPCFANQQAAWDEIVVFQEAQALPRFWVELEPNMVKSMPDLLPIHQISANGFNIQGLCQYQQCPLQGKKFVVHKGFNNFDLGEEYFDLACSCCNSPTDLIDSVIFKECSYSYKGTDKDKKQVSGANPNLSGRETIPVSGWKSMQIEVKPKK